MKIVILQADGMAGLPVPGFEGQTPLERASTPVLDSLVGGGECGRLMLGGERAASIGVRLHLALLGYDPRKYYSGPGAFAAAGLEVVLGSQDVAYLCNLVTLGSQGGRSDGKKLSPQVIMDDDTAGGIDREEVREFIGAINEQLGSETIQFYAGTRHRHLMVWVNGVDKATCFDPHPLKGLKVGAYLPRGEGANILNEFMEASRVILRNHPINQDREVEGKKPVNGLWLWGPGKSIDLPKLAERHQISAGVVSTVDVHLGIGNSSGCVSVNPEDEGDVGGIPYDQYLDRTLELLHTHDLVYLHVPEDPEISQSSFQEKVSRIEEFDEKVVGRLMKELLGFGTHRLVVVCNHPDTQDPTREDLSPLFVVWNGEGKQPSPSRSVCHEKAEAFSIGGAKDATRILDQLLGRSEHS